MKWSRLRSVLLTACLSLSFVFQGASAATSTPYTVYSDTEMVTTDGCMRTYIQLILDRDADLAVAGVDLYVIVEQTNTCTGVKLLQLQGGGYHTDLAFDSAGADVNTKVRATDFAQNVAGKEFDIWINYRLKCVNIQYRSHPGVTCDATAIGHIAFGKWSVESPGGITTILNWR